MIDLNFPETVSEYDFISHTLATYSLGKLRKMSLEKGIGWLVLADSAADLSIADYSMKIRYLLDSIVTIQSDFPNYLVLPYYKSKIVIAGSSETEWSSGQHKALFKPTRVPFDHARTLTDNFILLEHKHSGSEVGDMVRHHLSLDYEHFFLANLVAKNRNESIDSVIREAINMLLNEEQFALKP